MSEDRQQPNLNTYIMLIGFLVSFAASIGSYFKALADIRQENQQLVYQLMDKQRDEYSRVFASKEETNFIKELLLEQRADMKDLKIKLERR